MTTTIEPTAQDTSSTTTEDAADAGSESAGETEMWSASTVGFDVEPDGSYSGTISVAAQHASGDIFITPFEVTVALLGDWALCTVDSDSWNATIQPQTHPRVDNRTWELHERASQIEQADDGSATLSVEYAVVSGDDTATLTVTADIAPGCQAADEPDTGSPDDSESADTGSETQEQTPAADSDESQTQTEDEPADDEADEGSEESETDDGDENATSTEDEPADDEADEGSEEAEVDDDPITVTTEPQPVQFRRWNHQALIDLPLWSHCPPEDWGSISDRLDGYDITWAGWDTAAIEIDGRWIAVGYLTDAQIDRWLPGSGITADDAIANLHYNEAADSTLIWRGSVTMHAMNTPRLLPTLKAAMQARGIYSDNLVSSLKVTRYGIDGSGAWPADVHIGLLLTDWVRWRYSWPPTTAEPVAWPLRSLFEARESTCAGEALIAMCASDETPPAVLAKNHPIGRVLRSLACAE